MVYTTPTKAVRLEYCFTSVCKGPPVCRLMAPVLTVYLIIPSLVFNESFATTGTFRCTFCQTEVEEDESVCPDARTLVARFNEQIEPIYALLRETEDINLSHDLLEPEPAEIPALKQRSVSEKSDRNTPLITLSQSLNRTFTATQYNSSCLV